MYLYFKYSCKQTYKLVGRRYYMWIFDEYLAKMEYVVLFVLAYKYDYNFYDYSYL